VKKVNVLKLFEMQRGLDAHIQMNHQLQNESLVEKKILALLVEIGELANETRCFKFWSLKAPAATEKILEEFVDGVHFILSLGLECQFENKMRLLPVNKTEHLTNQFLAVFETVHEFRISQTLHNFEKLFTTYLTLGEMLGFNQEAIEKAYILKNEVNYERQEKGY
jgi:dimeric dUTPase (all-alpha-NTP-PPase superfamily)